MLGVYEDQGIRFEYPPDWELEVSEDGSRTTAAVQAPGGLAFVMVTLDEDRPEPDEMADEALAAMREEYPELEATPAVETLGGHRAEGHDLEFFSLDIVTSCAIRGYRSRRHTVLVFSQWSDLAGEDAEAAARAIRRSIEETE